MLSIIVCSINPEKIGIFRNNIAKTIGEGVKYEIICHDNRKDCLPIAKVYNKCAHSAQYPNLLFIHEDAGFASNVWWPEIEKKLAQPDCGVIGFAGTKVMLNIPSGWNVMKEGRILHLIENDTPVFANPFKGGDFEEAVAVDGFAMFVRKKVWKEHPFDERLLTGFHCYDVDFCIGIGASYKNFICTSVVPYHNSSGNFGKDWIKQTLHLYENKWKYLFPIYTSDYTLKPDKTRYYEERALFRFIKQLNKSKIRNHNIMRRFLKYPLTPRHTEHLLKLFFRKIMNK